MNIKRALRNLVYPHRRYDGLYVTERKELVNGELRPVHGGLKIHKVEDGRFYILGRSGEWFLMPGKAGDDMVRTIKDARNGKLLYNMFRKIKDL
ncbi:hypothetical protein NMJ21_000278 [Escherichia coli]|nr:hypothetical protein [Escherichia coli]EFI0057653.1 hypothetical protein [Escherichia coli]EFJ6979684.1 hypothetical protein [Escherichia coli]EFK5491821.1 hypothetical protein [Escherichia coli]EFK9478118.1 hypothetical protein [Escherichia coli]